MKAAITAKDKLIDCELEPVFDRTRYFIIFDTYKPDVIDIIPNPYSRADDCGDIFASRLIINEGIELLTTGRCNPVTQKLLHEAGIKINYTSVDTIRNIMKRTGNVAVGRTCSISE